MLIKKLLEWELYCHFTNPCISTASRARCEDFKDKVVHRGVTLNNKNTFLSSKLNVYVEHFWFIIGIRGVTDFRLFRSYILAEY